MLKVLKKKKKKKGGKSANFDEITVQFLTKGGALMVQWLRRSFSIFLNNGKAPKD